MSDLEQVRPHVDAVVVEVSDRVGRRFAWQQQLVGGEQSGAHLLTDAGDRVVLKWESPGWKADQILGAFPAVVHATAGGWPAARWLYAGSLSTGGAFVVQEYALGSPVRELDDATVRLIVGANDRQRGLALPGATDDSSQLEAVLRGDHPWQAAVAEFTPAGAALVAHGNAITGSPGPMTIPATDVVHGDYSSSNLLLDPAGTAITLVDCQTVGRGSRVRDLADLYRQSFVYPSPNATGVGRLRTAALAAEGPKVFARCAVAVTYNNLAWWVEHKTPTEFDRACARLHELFDILHHDR